MAGDSESRTSSTLLGRLRRDPTDQDAWGEFVNRYGPQIYGWCRKRGLQDADAQDVAQTVLVKLAVKMRDFAYDPADGPREALTMPCSTYQASVRRTMSSNERYCRPSSVPAREPSYAYTTGTRCGLPSTEMVARRATRC